MNLLVVDDDFVCKTMMQSICKQLGECQAVENGQDAIDAFTSAVDAGEPFAVITLDKSLPDMDGIEVLQAIRKEEAAREIPRDQRVKVIMVTATTEAEEIARCTEAGCDDYIAKPFRRAAVTEKLLSHLA